VTVLDCKLHGLAVVLQTPGGKTWLVDTGPSPKGDQVPARDVITTFLQQAGVKALDGILISHPHGDHRGGLPYLMEHYRINRLVDAGYDEIGGIELLSYRKLRAQYVAGGGKSVIVKLGAKLSLDPELDVEVLWPPKGLHRPDPKRKDEALYNSNSIVLRVRHGSIVYLFPGDNHGIAGLGKFVAPEKLKCDLLVAPHHGLNSHAGMAAATKPRFVIVPSLQEYLNPLIRPYELTKTAFEASGSTVYATWVHGTITAVSDGRTLRVTTAQKP
jgi:competence protein ComEC